MKFTNIYNETEENLRLALLSLWTPGKHPLRKAVEDLFRREPLITEPVFQSTFGWETVPDDMPWRDYLNTETIENLEIGEMHTPYLHQAKSWKSLGQRRSIVVTSGTGSGKTECFMYPVLSDLSQRRDENAVQAIFLYPLNALMEDQKKRLSDYCQATGLSFAVYNGSTPEFRAEAGLLPCEVGTRQAIRDKMEEGFRPQILLTNPSMLEYILVRQQDQVMLDASAGKLRWIVIDEAHSYSGSAALELKNQIKRILEAFGVEAKDVRFACTSATIGGPEGEESLKNFISALIGQDPASIDVVGGRRIVPEISEDELSKALENKGIDVLAGDLLALRDSINATPGMTLRQMWERLRPGRAYDIQQALRLVDELCELNVDGKAVLSLRAHFFMRALSGLYACGNPGCEGAGDTPYGHITSYKSIACPHCGRPLLELVQCKRCSSFILMGQSDPQSHVVSPVGESMVHEDYFAVDEDPYDEDEENRLADSYRHKVRQSVFFALPTAQLHSSEGKIHNPLSSAHMGAFDLVGAGAFEKLEKKQHGEGKWTDLQKDDRHSYCPKCGCLAQGKRMYFKYFRIPVSFINQTVSPVFLKESAPADRTWGKYIAFTDSRQGTAISAKTFNIEVERRMCRSRLTSGLASLPKIDLNIPPFKGLDEIQLKGVLAALGMDQGAADGISLYRLTEKMFDAGLFCHIARSDKPEDRLAYKHALLRSFIGQKQTLQKDAENLGILRLHYPALKDARIPESLEKLAARCGKSLTDQDWKDFLKIALDYGIRANNHIHPLMTGERKYVRDSDLSQPIAEGDWFSVTKSRNGQSVLMRQPRLIVLLCAALGVDTAERLREAADDIDKVLRDAWIFLTENILTKVDDQRRGYNDSEYYKYGQHVGKYYLDLSPDEYNRRCFAARPEKGWVCPVTGAVLDTVFFGFSPMITGEVSKGLFDAYRVADRQIALPQLPADEQDIHAWMDNDEGIKALRENGLWSDRHKYAYMSFPSYLAAEHSAQQSKELLDEYTKDFKDNVINVLHCSTTMEMGVDIGDIDVVLMDTVPPTPANYQQRVGRAGRKGQTKSVAFSLCANTPMGQFAFANPMWAIQSVNHMIPVRPSRTILQRHVNSYFFRQFICTLHDGMNVMTKVGGFMGGESSACDQFVQYLESEGASEECKRHFHHVFGPDVPFTIDRTISDIRKIQEKYVKVIEDLEKAHDQFEGDKRRQQAIAIQRRRYSGESLLKYLSEQQFLPNANMPTGVCTFDFMDKEQHVKLVGLYRELDKINKDLEKAQGCEKTDLEKGKFKKENEINDLKKATQASRDIQTALNEYAPEQTVVVNEKNYVSAGVTMLGAYDEETQTRALYFCRKCGAIEYLPRLEESKRCRCGENFHAIIGDSDNVSYTRAYEPVGFRTDQHIDGSREEQTDKRYYEIKPILLDSDWSDPVDTNMSQTVSSGETGEILYFNAGNGHGFSFCKRCGRAAVEYAKAGGMPVKVAPGHLRLWANDRGSDRCEANDGDIARHVVFTGRLQTCYSVMRFRKDHDSEMFENDESFVYSMGVVLKRALCEYLGVDETEIDFGCKKEKDFISLFIFDTARGGCGYSLHLANPAECAEIFDIARRKVSEYGCDCRETGGACTRCLIDRSNYRFANLLDTSKVAEWLEAQGKRKAVVPAEVAEVSPEARVVYRSLGKLADYAAANPEVRSIDFFASDCDGDISVSDWTSVRSRMGRILRKAAENEKLVRMMVEYHPDLHPSMPDRYPFATLDGRIPDCESRLVNDMGFIKPAMVVTYSDGRIERYFITDPDGLPMSEEWGERNEAVFVDAVVPEYEEAPFPELNDQSLVIREGRAVAKTFEIKHYFSKVIADSTLESEDIDRLKDILYGKRVTIVFNDKYVNSALAALMSAYLMKEIRDLFGLAIDDVLLQWSEEREDCRNDRFSDGSKIHHNWRSASEADDYTFRVLGDVVGVEPERLDDRTTHHRFLKITTEDGDEVEIRPDHSIAGGWKSDAKYKNVGRLDGNVEVRRDEDEDIRYYVFMRRHD